MLLGVQEIRGVAENVPDNGLPGSAMKERGFRAGEDKIVPAGVVIRMGRESSLMSCR